MAGSTKKTKPLTPIQKHKTNICGCERLVNPEYCVYQPFLDGWDFTPDVGNGQKRGEVFTPRFIVDRMIVDGKILPEKAVYEYDYTGSYETLRKYIGKRVFEPAVGTGNFISTILYHKLEYANSITRPEEGARTPLQVRRYQAYSLVALASIYFNDIDAGNLQTTKWRLFRDKEINHDDNITFWTTHVQESLATEVDTEVIRPLIEASIKTAGDNWGTFDDDKGVLDVLYKKHIGQESPEWLKSAWKIILDENAKLFNGIAEEDVVEEDFVCAGYKNVQWVFWWFDYKKKDTITATQTIVPMKRQILESKINTLVEKTEELKNKGNKTGELEDGILDIFQDIEFVSFATPEDEKEHKSLNKTQATLEKELLVTPKYETLDSFDFVRDEE